MSRENEIIENYQTYISRSGKNGMTEEEIAPLVLNLAYLEVLNQRKKGILVNDFNILKEYADAAEEIFPDMSNLTATWPGFQATLAWDGLWDFLREYFQNKLGQSIDNVDVISETYNSSFHKRYENNAFTSESAVERIIKIIFSEDKKECLLSISPTLSEKKAYLKTTENNRYTYIGSDPDYKFVITFDFLDNVEHVTLILTHRNVRIEYFE
ncbi:hypothetical protein [Gaetbulibacter saemankumensis]|uniref:hypothetical protein n=1 Tax=Gaetbulibacter saemankumensis TaxID=311208 RepID=UPI00040F34DF|nr:hypothetical protein [Gaetbulibacter saemankumensis]